MRAASAIASSTDMPAASERATWITTIPWAGATSWVSKTSKRTPGKLPRAVAAAIATAGGTSAATGSRDAALLVDLPPGTYSANVTSSDGSTGTAQLRAEVVVERLQSITER